MPLPAERRAFVHGRCLRHRPASAFVSPHDRASPRAAPALQPTGGPLRPVGFVAGHVSRQPRPDHCRDLAVDDGAGPGRLGADVVGGIGLSGRLDRDDADLRPAQRPLRPAPDPPGVDRAVCAGLGVVRAVADDGAADRRAGVAGGRRRRSALGLAGGDRRRGPAARARPLPGLFFQRDGGLEPAGAGARRVFCRLPVVALDLLDQHPVRRLGAGPVQPQPAALAAAQAQAGHRLAWRRADRRLDNTAPDRRRPGRVGGRLVPPRRLCCQS